MIMRKRSKREMLTRVLSMKTILIGLMVATFMIFASGCSTTMEGTEISAIIVGASLFALVSAMLLKAGEISKKLCR